MAFAIFVILSVLALALAHQQAIAQPVILLHSMEHVLHHVQLAHTTTPTSDNACHAILSASSVLALLAQIAASAVTQL